MTSDMIIRMNKMKRVLGFGPDECQITQLDVFTDCVVISDGDHVLGKLSLQEYEDIMGDMSCESTQTDQEPPEDQ